MWLFIIIDQYEEDAVVLSQLKSSELNEVSGIAASKTHKDILYMINDSGATNV